MFCKHFCLKSRLAREILEPVSQTLKVSLSLRSRELITLIPETFEEPWVNFGLPALLVKPGCHARLFVSEQVSHGHFQRLRQPAILVKKEGESVDQPLQLVVDFFACGQGQKTVLQPYRGRSLQTVLHRGVVYAIAQVLQKISISDFQE